MLSRLRLLRTGVLLVLVAVLGVTSSTGLAAAVPATWNYVGVDGGRRAFAPPANCPTNVTDGGEVGADVTGCANPTYQPPTLANVALPTGGTGDLEYAWMRTTTDPEAGGPVTWQIIPGTNAPDYTPPPLTATTYFMRCSRRSGCTEYAGETNYVTVTIDCCDNVTDGGAIDGDEAVCGTPYDPGVIRSVAPATGGSNATEYQWYVSTTTDVYAVGDAAWAPIGGATGATYNPGEIAEVTHYVRTARKEFCADIGGYTNVVTIAAHPLPTITTEVTAASCHDATDGTATVTVVEAAAPTNVRWLDDPTTDLARANLAPGTYTFEIEDTYGCVTTADLVVTAPEELLVTADAEFDACFFADDATITANVTGGTEPYNYRWSTGATTRVIANQPAGTYDVAITDANNCTATDRVVVNPPPAFQASIAFTDPDCYQSDGTIDVTATGGVAPYTYDWSHDPALTGASASNLPGGDYVVVVTDVNACEITLNATLDDTPDIAIALDADDVSCNGAADGAIASAVTGGTPPYTYAWSNGATGSDVANLGPGSYTLTVTDANLCTADATATIAEPPALTASIAVVQPVCREDGGTLTAGMTGGNPPYSFSWSPRGADDQTVLANQPAGTYTLTVTDDIGCTATATATVDDVPLLELTGSAVDASCPSEPDGSATVSATGGEPGYTYRWNDPADQTTATATNLVPGAYTAEVTDNRGCVRTVDVTVGATSPGPLLSADVTDLTCNGAADGAIDLSVGGGPAPYRYEWTDDGVASGVTTQDRTGLAPGEYRVLVEDALGCTAEATYEVAAPLELEVVAAPASFYPDYFHVSAYGATDGSAAATVTGGTPPYDYSWQQDGNFVSTASVADAIAGGAVTVVVTDANGCTATHDTVLVEPSMISDFVWEDIDGDGVQGAGEPGFEGVSVRLTGRDFNNRNVNFLTLTDAAGNYRFDRLPPGNYIIFVTLPDDYEYSPVDQGADDAADSDIDFTGVMRRAVAGFGTADVDSDAGLIPSANAIVIGDYIWYDADHDGIQDPFEIPAQGVTMRLYRVSDGVLIASTLSDEDGNYAFEDVVPGEYYVEVDAATSTIASGFVLAFQDVGGDDAVDSDFDPVTARSGTIVVTTASADINDVDAGLHEDCNEVIGSNRIAGNEDVCVGDLPAAITSVAVPANAARFQWYRSDSPTYRGRNDPNWFLINGATGIDYQPSTLATTNYYLRLATTASCADDFTSESNIIEKRAVPSPGAEIAGAETSDGVSGTRTSVSLCDDATLTMTADSIEPVDFYWDFGPDATPRFDTGRVVSGISFATADAYIIYLETSNVDGCTGVATYQVNVLNCSGGGSVGTVGASATTRGNDVAWAALSLRPEAYFEVERAVGAADFETIDRVDAAVLGRWHDYTYTDRFAPGGEVAYRILHAAPLAEPTRSESVRVRGHRAELLTRIYPNPVDDALTVEVAATRQGDVAYELTNAFGARLLTGTTRGGRSALHLDDLPSGTYHLRLIAPDGESTVQTVLKR